MNFLPAIYNQGVVNVPWHLTAGHALSYGDVCKLAELGEPLHSNDFPWSRESDNFLIISSGEFFHLPSRSVRWRVEVLNDEGVEFTYVGRKRFNPFERDVLVCPSKNPII